MKLGTHKQTGRKVAVKVMRLPEGGTLRGMYAMHQAKARALACGAPRRRFHARTRGLLTVGAAAARAPRPPPR